MEREEYQDTEIGRIPRDWKVVRLGEVAFVRYGKANPKTPGNVPVIGSGGIYDFTESALVSFRTIVIGRKGSAGEAVLMNEPCWPSDTTFYLEWKSQISPAWVFYWLTLRKPSPEGTTATLPSLRREDLESHVIPLPPLEEQKRIVARVEELMGRVREARRLREEAKQEAERLWQAVLAQTFPRPGSELPEGWRWVQLGNVADVFSGTWGKDPSPQNSGKATLVRVIRVSDIKETLTIDYDNVPWRCVAQKDVKRLALRDGDIVVVKSSGSKAKVISGRAALFRQQPETFLPSNFVFAVRCNTDKVNPGFLWYWLNSDPVKRFVEQMVATFTYPNLKKSDYVKVPIPLPPLEEQKRIVVYLQEVQEKIKALKVAQEQTEEQLKRLEQAILDKAFRGEL